MLSLRSVASSETQVCSSSGDSTRAFDNRLFVGSTVCIIRMASEQNLVDGWTLPVVLAPGWPAVRIAVTETAPAALAEWPHGGRFARHLIVDVVDSLGEVRLAAVKVQNDDPPPVTVDPFGCRWDNLSISEGLKRASGACVGRSASMPSTSWCRITGKAFRNFCPETLSPLQTCRDDALLEAMGLESFSTSRIRYEVPLESLQRQRFYTWALDGGRSVRDGVVVRRRGELYRDYGMVFRSKWSESQTLQLERTFPCWTCAHREECYGLVAGDVPMLVESRLDPIAFHEAEAQLVYGIPVSWDAALKLLGGASAADVFSIEFGEGNASKPLAACLSRAASWLDGQPWLSTACKKGLIGLGRAASKQLALEVAMTKLRLFHEICLLVAAYHRNSGQPYGELSRKSLRVHFGFGEWNSVPSRWQLSAVLLHDDFVPVVEAGSLRVGRFTVTVPAPATDPLRWSSLIEASAFRSSAQGKLKMFPAKGSWVAEFSAPHTRFQRTSPGDVARLVLGRSQAGAGLDEVVGVVAEVKPGWLKIDLSGWDAPEQVVALGELEMVADLVTHQKYGSGCDLWAMGALLACLLVGNDSLDSEAAEELLRGLVGRLQSHVGAAHGSIEDLARSLIQQTQVLEPGAVLWPGELRECLGKAPIPATLWCDIWVLVLRLSSVIPGFSYVTAYSQAAPMEELIESVRTLALRLEAEAFCPNVRREEISVAVARQMAALALSAGKTVSDSQ